MSYEIVKKWLDDPTSVTEEEVDNAYQAMFLLQPNGANQNLIDTKHKSKAKEV